MKRLMLFISAVLISVGTFAQFNLANRKQSNQSNQPQNKFYFGGGGGFGSGTDPFGYRYNYYSLLPIAGYRINAQYSVGASFTYQRYNYVNTPVGNYSYTQYGFGPFVRYSINPVFLQAEYDVISAPAYDNNNELVRSNYSRFLVGLGYAIPMGKRSAVNALAMYDLLYKTPSVFLSPIVLRVYFTF